MNGWITDIQRFSLKDGPGIRTTVFFKGCNLKCTWCHNPETISGGNRLLFYENRCIGCGACVAACPNGAHRVENGRHIIDRDRCTGCGRCADGCFSGALRMAARSMTVEEVMHEVRQDRLYYNESGGGVTLSGGEVLCQQAFAAELLAACRAEGISIAVESNICFDFSAIRDTLAQTDLIMCDLKCADDDAHRRYTGVSNAKIIANLKQIDELGIPMIVRTPLIPGATDGESNIRAVARILAPLKRLRYYELLNFNPLGAPKYDALGQPYAFRDARPLPAGRLDVLRKCAEEAGIPVRVG